jgi:hypothetical protein
MHKYQNQQPQQQIATNTLKNDFTIDLQQSDHANEDLDNNQKNQKIKEETQASIEEKLSQNTLKILRQEVFEIFLA